LKMLADTFLSDKRGINLEKAEEAREKGCGGYSAAIVSRKRRKGRSERFFHPLSGRRIRSWN